MGELNKYKHNNIIAYTYNTTCIAWLQVCNVTIKHKNKQESSKLRVQQQYTYILCIYLFFLIYDHLCIPCLADRFPLPPLYQ